jgi:adenine-specific DNA-methyltransferase
MQNSPTGAISGLTPSRSASPDETANAFERLAGLAKACGAADAGGALSPAERVWLERAVAVPASEVRAARNQILAGGDPLGDTFLSIRSVRQRRGDGAFYTGEAIRHSMVAWALQHEPQRLIDPGCGSGRFAGHALRERPQLPVLALDTDPIATLMTRALLAVLKATNAGVMCGDYLTAHIPRIDGRTAFVGNPPYVRHHDIDAAVKEHIATLASEAGLRGGGLAGLYVWFFAATYARHGVPGDIGAFVTSAQWMDSTYGHILRELLAGSLGGRSLLTFEAASSPFDAMTTASIATFEIGCNASSMLIGTAPAQAGSFELERVGHAVDRDVLRVCARWSQNTDPSRAPDSGPTIGSRFRVSRGQVTGDNAFFVMSGQRAIDLGIDAFCIPAISAAREILSSGGAVSGHTLRRVALCVPPDTDLAGVPALARYIAEGEQRAVHLRYIPSHRKPWYAIAYPRPPIVATYMARRPPYFAENPDGAAVLNIAHGLFPRALMDRAALRETVERLNAARARFAGRGRTYHGGLQKFEPGDLAALPLYP